MMALTFLIFLPFIIFGVCLDSLVFVDKDDVAEYIFAWIEFVLSVAACTFSLFLFRIVILEK